MSSGISPVVPGNIRGERPSRANQSAAQPSPRQGGGGRTDHPATDRSDPDDREGRLTLLADQIAAVERGEAEGGTSDRETAGTHPDRSDRLDGGRAPGAGRRRKTAGRRSGDRSEGAELSPAQQSAAARAICLRLLTVAPRPRAGLAQALRRKEIPDDIAEAVLDRLTQVGLIDDVAYAHSFVRTKHRDRALGRSALRTELRRLGVDEESVADAVETVDPGAERARAQELISKRLDAAMGAGSVAARRRLLGLLGRRGYPPDIALSVVDDAIAGYADGRDEWR